MSLFNTTLVDSRQNCSLQFAEGDHQTNILEIAAGKALIAEIPKKALLLREV